VPLVRQPASGWRRRSGITHFARAYRTPHAHTARTARCTRHAHSPHHAPPACYHRLLPPRTAIWPRRLPACSRLQAWEGLHLLPYLHQLPPFFCTGWTWGRGGILYYQYAAWAVGKTAGASGRLLVWTCAAYGSDTAGAGRVSRYLCRRRELPVHCACLATLLCKAENAHGNIARTAGAAKPMTAPQTTPAWWWLAWRSRLGGDTACEEYIERLGM